MKKNFASQAGRLTLALAILPASFAAPAAAQEATADAQPADQTPVSDAGINAIIVTAERRSEDVQNSSLSISVLGEDALASIDDAWDISDLVPGVEITAGGVTLQSFIRGIGDFGSSSLNQTAVAYNIDGVYVANTAEVSTQFYDLERVEVLKGPQGTLYGRNASAGAINLIPARPRLGQVSGEATADIGNYDHHHLGAAVNVLLGEDAALRASGTYNDPSDIFSVTAFIRNITDEQIARGANLRGGIVYAEVAPPRTYGIHLSAKY